MKKFIQCAFSIILLLLITTTVFGQETNGDVEVVFSQKGGMLVTGDHSLYLRTNDEWTGFSTFYFGYRYAVSDWFNFAVEGGISAVPHVYLVGLLMYFKFYESPNNRLFIGLRTRSGYKFQNSDFSTDGWADFVGEDYLVLYRHSIYLASDFTISIRFGKEKRYSIYYSIYPRFDFGFAGDVDPQTHFLFSPIVLGYEVRFGKKRRWNFAIEAGYAFPIPWDSIPKTEWVNFPSLANFGFYFRW